MTQAPHCANLRAGQKMGDLAFIDTMIRDGLWDAFNGYHMGNTAENVAEKFQITRDQQDEFAQNSQRKAGAAMAAGRFADEIAPVTVKGRKGDTVVKHDEYIQARHPARRPPQAAPRLRQGGHGHGRQCFGHQRRRGGDPGDDGRRSDATAASRRWRASCPGRPRAWTRRSWAPGPIPASRKALKKAGWSIDDLDLIEANEAFAAQACAVNKDMGWDPSKVNVNGGAIALGHPIGASGARVLTTLLFEMKRRGAKKGLATLVHRRRHGRGPLRGSRLTSQQRTGELPRPSFSRSR